MKTVKIRLDGLGGMPMDEKTLKSTYATGMDFEPDERRMTIDSEGIVSLQVTKEPYMIHVKMAVPLYGHLWVMADNQGEGYTGEFVDFVTEAIRTYIHHAQKYAAGITLSPTTQGHLDAAIELQHLANRGQDTPDNRLAATSRATRRMPPGMRSFSRRRSTSRRFRSIRARPCRRRTTTIIRMWITRCRFCWTRELPPRGIRSGSGIRT